MAARGSAPSSEAVERAPRVNSHFGQLTEQDFGQVMGKAMRAVWSS